MNRFAAALVVVAATMSGPALSAPVNLVLNGDFEAGNTLFSSDYTYSPANNSAAAQYTVRTDPFPWNPFFVSAGDHTSGSGNMFVGNGAPVNNRVWYSGAIAVTPNTDYFFEAWVMNVCCNPSFGQGNNPVSPAVFSFYAGDELLGTRTTNSLGVWEALSTTWNSGSNTTIVLNLFNSNLEPNGNDFAVDDVFLGTESSITVAEPASLALLGTGLLVLARGRRRRG